MEVFDRIIHMAYTQTLWQFISTLAVTKINKSTYQAKENAVMTLFYINVIRMVLMVIMKNNPDRLLPLEFMDEMANIQDWIRIHLECYGISQY